VGLEGGLQVSLPVVVALGLHVPAQVSGTQETQHRNKRSRSMPNYDSRSWITAAETNVPRKTTAKPGALCMCACTAAYAVLAMHISANWQASPAETLMRAAAHSPVDGFLQALLPAGALHPAQRAQLAAADVVAPVIEGAVLQAATNIRVPLNLPSASRHSSSPAASMLHPIRLATHRTTLQLRSARVTVSCTCDGMTFEHLE
jgi:hypothetical protein